METTTRHSDSPLTPEEIRDLLGEDDLDGVPFARITTSSRAVSGSSEVVPASFVPSTRPRVDVLSSTPLPEIRRSPAPAAEAAERPRTRPIATDDLREVRSARAERATPGVSGASRVVPHEDADTRAASREALRALYEKNAQRPGSASGPVRRVTEVRERVSVSGAHERVDQQAVSRLRAASGSGPALAAELTFDREPSQSALDSDAAPRQSDPLLGFVAHLRGSQRR